MAKFCGDYAVLNGGGAPAWAFLTLLGPEKVDVYLRFDEKGTQGGSHAMGGRCPRGRATCARWLCPSLTVVQPLRAQDVVARVQTRPGAPRPERRAAETDAAAVGATRRHAHARRDLGAPPRVRDSQPRDDVRRRREAAGRPRRRRHAVCHAVARLKPRPRLTSSAQSATHSFCLRPMPAQGGARALRQRARAVGPARHRPFVLGAARSRGGQPPPACRSCATRLPHSGVPLPCLTVVCPLPHSGVPPPTPSLPGERPPAAAGA